MASSQLYIAEQPTTVQSGSDIQPTITQLQTKESTPANARLFTVSPGVPSTKVFIKSNGVRSYFVINDTPLPPGPVINIILSYLYSGVITPTPVSGSKMKRWTGSVWVDVATIVVFE